MLNIPKLKNQISKYSDYYSHRLRTFISEYEKQKSIILKDILTEFDFLKQEKTITFVASGLPFFTFDVLNSELKHDFNYLEKFDKLVNNENGLLELTLVDYNVDDSVVESKNKKVNLIDYSPMIKSTYHIIKEHFENLDFEYHDRNVNFEDITDITKDSLVIIPYSEYLYILNELKIFNKGQYVLVFNQKDDDEKRKINTALCVEDLTEQCRFSEIIFSKKYNVCGINMYLALGKV
jgi:hypothetical protein